MRSLAAQIVRQSLAHPEVEVVPRSRQAFLDGLALHQARLDKGYSLTDCISMETMCREGLTEVLTRDVHSIQGSPLPCPDVPDPPRQPSSLPHQSPVFS